MRFPTIWYVRSVKPQISLHIRPYCFNGLTDTKVIKLKQLLLASFELYFHDEIAYLLVSALCKYNGVAFKQGQRWDDGCDLQCVCEDETTGYYRCNQRLVKYYIDRASYMSDHVLFNLLIELRKRDKCEACQAFYLLFATSLNQFNNTGAGMLDSINHMTLKLCLKSHIRSEKV